MSICLFLSLHIDFVSKKTEVNYLRQTRLVYISFSVLMKFEQFPFYNNKIIDDFIT